MTFNFDRCSVVDAQHACFDKKFFSSKNQARDVAARKGLRFYKCLVCSGYHLTGASVKRMPKIKNALRRRA